MIARMEAIDEETIPAISQKAEKEHPMGNVIGNNETTFESMNELNLPVVSWNLNLLFLHGIPLISLGRASHKFGVERKIQRL